MKKLVCIWVLAAVFGSMVPVYGGEPAGLGKSYSDVQESQWFFSAIMWLSEAGIVSGDPEGTFRPEEEITYGEFISMAVEAVLGEQEQSKRSGHWAEASYEKALEAGFYTREDIPLGNLEMPMPRNIMALICSRAAGDTERVRGADFDVIASYLRDVDEREPYQYEIVQSFGLGILAGYPDQTFRPKGTLTRAEASSVIWRLLLPQRRTLPDMADLAVKAQEKEAGRSQQERILQVDSGAVGDISFNMDTDVNEDGTMSEEKAREYLDRILASLRFYGSDGNYYMTVTLPKAPEGFRTAFSADVYFRPQLMKSPWAATNNWTMMEKDRIPGEGTITRRIEGMESLDQVFTASAGFSMNRIDGTDDGSRCASYQILKDVEGKGEYDSFGINRYGTEKDNTPIEYSLSRHFQWK